jgi:hypothetical protein
VFLATIIPNPVRYHVFFEMGHLNGTWNRRLRDLIRKMQGNGTIDVPQAFEAEFTPLRFHRP